MQCANCLKDFKEDDKVKGFFTNQNEHFGRPYREFGIMCPFCGFHNTVISIPIKIPFVRSSRTYDRVDAMVEKFKMELEEYYKSKSKYRTQLNLYDDTETDQK